MNISKLANKTGVSVRSLRYYELKGLLKSSRLENGYRDFDESAVEQVKIIQTYLSLGLTTNEILPIIKCPVSISSKQPLCEKAIELYKSKLKEVEGQIKLLETLRKQLKERISNFEDQNLNQIEGGK